MSSDAESSAHGEEEDNQSDVERADADRNDTLVVDRRGSGPSAGDSREDEIKMRRAREAEKRAMIRARWLRNPELPINPTDPLAGKIDDLDEAELDMVLANMELNVRRATPWSPSEKGVIHALCVGMTYVGAPDIEAELLDDVEAKVDFREMTENNLPFVGWPSVRFVTRAIAMMGSKLASSFAHFRHHVAQEEIRRARELATATETGQAPLAAGVAVPPHALPTPGQRADT